MQISGEYVATTLQTYQVARAALPAAVADSTWTALGYLPDGLNCEALPPQTNPRQYAQLPPAIIVDIDDTVVDNTAFQARLILQDVDFNRERFKRWTDEARAPAIHGAVEFLSYAAGSLGVEIVYVTNRTKSQEEATRRNLLTLGFPLEKVHDTELTMDYDLVLTRKEYDKTSGEDKHARRRLVARSYRVLMLIGDNLGDFLPCVDELTAAGQKRVAREASRMWGNKWFVLPNPVYGIWAPRPYKSRADQLKRKYEMLDALE